MQSSIPVNPASVGSSGYLGLCAAAWILLILDFQLPEAVLRQRIDLRLAAGGDPSEAHQAVLDAQLVAQEPLTASEEAVSIRVVPEKQDLAAEVVRYFIKAGSPGVRRD